MFGEGGYFYVYFTYGAHYCCNIVTGKSGEGTAVLIRAVEPVEGIEEMVWNRYKKRSAAGNKELYNLTSGPGKVCRAFGIDKRDYGLDLTGDVVYLLDNRQVPGEKIAATQRIGVTRSAELLWRFYIKDNPFISKR
jgi:DNA-3-methyladenine glycosylase